MAGKNNFPKLHNAMWPGLVGKGPDSEPPIDLDTMIALTAKAEVNGVKFDGIDIFHAAPHTNIDFTADEAKALAENLGPILIFAPRRQGDPLRVLAIDRMARIDDADVRVLLKCGDLHDLVELRGE